MLNSVVLFSTKYQHGSPIGLPMSPLTWTFLPPPFLSHSSRLSLNPQFEFPESYSKFPLAIYFTYGNVCFHVILYIHPTLTCNFLKNPTMLKKKLLSYGSILELSQAFDFRTQQTTSSSGLMTQNPSIIILKMCSKS